MRKAQVAALTKPASACRSGTMIDMWLYKPLDSMSDLQSETIIKCGRGYG